MKSKYKVGDLVSLHGKKGTFVVIEVLKDNKYKLVKKGGD